MTSQLFGEIFVQNIEDWVDYCQNRRNPVCQITYLLILNGAYLAWLCTGQPLLPVMFVGTVHIYIAFIGVIICHYTFYLACSVGPGEVTEETVSLFSHRPYDEVLFSAGR